MSDTLRSARAILDAAELVAAAYPEGSHIHKTATAIARAACRIIEQIQNDDGCIMQVEHQPAGHPASPAPVDDPAFDI